MDGTPAQHACRSPWQCSQQRSLRRLPNSARSEEQRSTYSLMLMVGEAPAGDYDDFDLSYLEEQ